MKNPESYQKAKPSRSSASILCGALSSTNASKAASKPASNAASPSGPDAPKRRPKLRPALDVLNRLRWDEAYTDDDFTIGYEDRFTGVVEVPMGSWKQEQTDEEFIPQHRILYFRRSADDVHLWDKKERIDRVFGSGIVGRRDEHTDEGEDDEKDTAVQDGHERLSGDENRARVDGDDDGDGVPAQGADVDHVDHVDA